MSVFSVCDSMSNFDFPPALPPSDMLYDIMDTIEGMSFSLKHDQDGE